MCDEARGIFLQQLLVAEAQEHGLGTVQAARVDADLATGEQPADRQRLEASLAVPLLDAVDADQVLRGNV